MRESPCVRPILLKLKELLQEVARLGRQRDGNKKEIGLMAGTAK